MIKKVLSGLVLVLGLSFLYVYTGDTAGPQENQTEYGQAQAVPIPLQGSIMVTDVTLPEAEEIPEGQVRSKLTGAWVDEEIGNRRPVAVMLSNVEAACPQTGIAMADIIYEAPVEGALTRLMGIFEDYDALDKIGSVRSARNYYVYYAAEYDAIYAHYGQSSFAEGILGSGNIDNLSGLESIGKTVYYRTSDRKAPHNAYASAEGITRGIQSKNYRTSYEDDFSGHFLFMEEAELLLSDGQPATKVVPGYQINTPYFEYREAEGVYYRYQYGDAQIDDRDQTHLAYKNIILQYTASDMYDYQCLNLNVSNSGAGMYITNGQAINITWQKESEWGKTTYYDEHGDELVLNQGKTWICIIQESRIDKVEIN